MWLTTWKIDVFCLIVINHTDCILYVLSGKSLCTDANLPDLQDHRLSRVSQLEHSSTSAVMNTSGPGATVTACVACIRPICSHQQGCSGHAIGAHGYGPGCQIRAEAPIHGHRQPIPPSRVHTQERSSAAPPAKLKLQRNGLYAFEVRGAYILSHEDSGVVAELANFATGKICSSRHLGFYMSAFVHGYARACWAP